MRSGRRRPHKRTRPAPFRRLGKAVAHRGFGRAKVYLTGPKPPAPNGPTPSFFIFFMAWHGWYGMVSGLAQDAMAWHGKWQPLPP